MDTDDPSLNPSRAAYLAERPAAAVAALTELSLPLTSQQARPNLEKSQTFPPSQFERRQQQQQQQQIAVSHLCPPFGSKSVIGRRAKMEDTCVAVPYFFEVPLCPNVDEVLPPRIAPQLRTNSSAERASDVATTTQLSGGSSDRLSAPGEPSSVPSVEAQQQGATATGLREVDDYGLETLHFFGVFDGHGGADAALHCAKTLHERVREVLISLTSPTAASPSDPAAEASTNSGATVHGDLRAEQHRRHHHQAAAAEAAEPPLGASPSAPVGGQLHSASSGSSFLDATDMEDDAAGEGATARTSGVLEGVLCTTETMEAALTRAFHLTDEEFGAMGGYEHLALVGTTAVVALVGSRMIYVANCGDSRAVLCRSGQAVPLTDDHKAAREDETARVEAAGGQILFWNGVRVMGLLAVSRAIGDHSLRPYVIAEPEVTIVNRHSCDELLVMASDGLWDVMSNQEACTLAKKCLQRARQRGSTRQSAARVAATVLTRAAVDRGSRDNVTVVIIDMSVPNEAELAEEGQQRATSAPAGVPLPDPSPHTSGEMEQSGSNNERSSRGEGLTAVATAAAAIPPPMPPHVRVDDRGYGSPFCSDALLPPGSKHLDG